MKINFKIWDDGNKKWLFQEGLRYVLDHQGNVWDYKWSECLSDCVPVL